jgi:HEAT repeat protein
LAHELIKSRLDDRVPGIRKLTQAAQAGKTAEGLAENLHDPAADVRHYAARALVFFNDPATLPALREACKDPDPEVRAAARLSSRRIERMLQANVQK